MGLSQGSNPVKEIKKKKSTKHWMGWGTVWQFLNILREYSLLQGQDQGHSDIVEIYADFLIVN